MSKELSVEVKDEAFTREVRIVWTDVPEVEEVIVVEEDECPCHY